MGALAVSRYRNEASSPESCCIGLLPERVFGEFDERGAIIEGVSTG
jgi:hypothetical protein